VQEVRQELPEHGMTIRSLRRRTLLKSGAFGYAATVLSGLAPADSRAAETVEPTDPDHRGRLANLTIREQRLTIAGRPAKAIAVNGSIPGPLLRFREGETVTIRVRNELRVTTSIHWHGLIVPWDMDGVPGVSFDGIGPGEAFTYRFSLGQAGTYWYHSHSGTQEQSGVYGPFVIDPSGTEPIAIDREYVVLLSDWTFDDPARVLAKTKKLGSYYNFARRTLGDVFRDAKRDGWRETLSDRLLWARIRMDPTDIADITGYTLTYLLNGRSPDENWTARFVPGERIRLRFINAGAATFFDVRIPGLAMTVVQADGQNVRPITIDEFRIAPAETYDVIVQPGSPGAHAIFAETMDRSGYAAGTIASDPSLRAPLPERRKRPLRTMADMGMAPGAMGGMPMADAGTATGEHDETKATAGSSKDPTAHRAPGEPSGDMAEMVMPLDEGPADRSVDMPAMQPDPAAVETPVHGPDHHGPGNSMVAERPGSRVGDPGVGLGGDGRRVLVYADLERLNATATHARPPRREIELHITGNMERQMWGFDGKKYSEAREPIVFHQGELLRVTLVNDTMMDHPMHLHGMWMRIENGTGTRRPLKHTINVKAGERLSFDVEPTESGRFAFHCHLLFHMELGMFRVVSVTDSASAAGS